MNRIEFIRQEEKKYHDYCYDNYKLFEEGSWLHKPVKTVIDLLPLFDEKENLRVLDIGCGGGRNSIPIVEKIKYKNGKVLCIDLLDSALNKLNEYSLKYNVDNVIQTKKEDIGTYEIMKNKYDLIVAVSSLEHVHSEKVFESVVQRMADGTKSNGINCIIVNPYVEEFDVQTNEK